MLEDFGDRLGGMQNIFHVHGVLFLAVFEQPTMLAHRGLNANTGHHQHSHHHNDGQV